MKPKMHFVLTCLLLSTATFLIANCSSPGGGDDGGGSTSPLIYAGGYRIGPSAPIAGYWISGSWHGLTPLDVTLDSVVYSLVVAGSDVYAAGFSMIPPVVEVAGYWLNGTWHGLTPLDATNHSSVLSLIVTGSDVYAGGFSAA